LSLQVRLRERHCSRARSFCVRRSITIVSVAASTRLGGHCCWSSARTLRNTPASIIAVVLGSADAGSGCSLLALGSRCLLMLKLFLGVV
ncbi:hypothetical protein KCU99_g168, partial [Aureobasidium melanogenum]